MTFSPGYLECRIECGFLIAISAQSTSAQGWVALTVIADLVDAQASKARLDAAVAAGYDPDAEFRSRLERQITGDELEDAELDGAEVDEDRRRPQGQEQPQSMTPDLDSEFNEQLSEEERQLEEDIMNPVG